MTELCVGLACVARFSITNRRAMDSNDHHGSRVTFSQALSLPTPLEEEPPPSVVCVETPPLVATPPRVTTPERSKLQKRLDSLRAPFKPKSLIHLAKSKSSDCENTSIITKQCRKSKNSRAADTTAKDGRGAAETIVRKLSGFGRLRPGADVVSPDPSSQNAVIDVIAKIASAEEEDSVSHSGSAEAAHDMEDSSVNQSSSDAEPLSVTSSREGIMANDDIIEIDKEMELKVNTKKGFDPAAIVVDHPVSTLPFAKSSWKRRRSQDLVRPVETPSPDSALRRRIAFVSQASVCFSEDQAEKRKQVTGDRQADAAGAALQRMVELAQLRLTADRGDTSGSYEKAESHAMTPAPHGDLIAANAQPDASMGAALVSSHATAAGGERREHLYKILVIGELGTGKTSIIKRYVHQFFSQHYRATIGVDFALKVLNWDAQTVIRLQLWDIAGQERFGNMTRVYYKEAVGAFVVFDVTRVATFDAVVKWKMDLDSKVQLPDGSPIPCILLANKCDQQKEGIVNTPSKMDEYCREKGFAGWFETSAKENVNIEEAARSLVNKILLNDKLLQSSEIGDNERFSLEHRAANGHDATAAGNKTCAC